MCLYPSTIDGKQYQYVRSFDDYEVLDMPHGLIFLLLEGDIKFSNNKKPKKHKPELQFKITDDQVRIQKHFASSPNSEIKMSIETILHTRINKSLALQELQARFERFTTRSPIEHTWTL